MRRKRYFDEEGDYLIAKECLRALVAFTRHNLVTEPAPPLGCATFDLILCRNVLIYFDSSTVDSVLSALEGALAPSGMLILGAADALCRGAARLDALAPLVSPGEPAVANSRVLRRPLGRLALDLSQPDVAHSRGPAGGESAPSGDTLSPTTDFLLGLAELEASNAGAAVAALRRTLYADPTFAVSLLGRSYEALGDRDAARRAYEQALRTFGPVEDERSELMLEQVSLEDVRAATTSRIDALRRESAGRSGTVNTPNR